MRRHFTVTGFVSTSEATLLHFHARNRMWLPPGGHVDPDEDPPQAVLREVEEETGLRVAILPTSPVIDYDEPPQLPVPVTIMVEDIADHPVDGPHQHIDLIYFTRPVGPAEPVVGVWTWVTDADLAANVPISPTADAQPVEIPEDVRVLGRAAIARTRRDP